MLAAEQLFRMIVKGLRADCLESAAQAVKGTHSSVKI